MTSLSLLLWIVLAIALQLAFYLGVGFWHHWAEYLALRRRAVTMALPPVQEGALESGAVAAAWPGLRGFRVSRIVVEDAAEAIRSFYLTPEDGQPLSPFLPGQFLTFRIEVPMASGGSEALVRCYSLSEAPRPDYYRVTIKRVAAPAGSSAAPGRCSNYFHSQITVGSRLQVRAPAGHFQLDRTDAPVVLIAGGIGVTPLLSMLNGALAEPGGRELWLFYSVRNGSELVMKSHLEALAAAHPNFHLQLCFSQPRPEEVPGSDYHHRGRIDIALLRMQLPLRPYHFYICGPTPMMESLVSALQGWGVAQTRIHFEAFGPASLPRPAAATSPPEATSDSGIVVTFARSGKALPWQPAAASLLDFAEANGIEVFSGCRAGGCGSCQTTIVSGEVSYRHPPDFDPEPGTCLLCVSVPKTSVTLEA